MAYPNVHVLPVVYVIDFDDTEGVDCDQTAADVAHIAVPFKCRLLRFGALITEVCAGATTTPVVSLDQQITAGSDTGRVECAVLTLGTSAAGKFPYEDPAAEYLFDEGDQLVVELKVAATGTGKTGHFRPVVLVEYIPEVPGNNTAMSAV